MKAIIVDDEPLARLRVKKLLKEYNQIEIIGESGEVSEAIALINAKSPDLVFLDIQMKSRSGFNVIDKLDKLPLIIFVTAYDKYALKAFDYFAFDYLLKPFKDERFHACVRRALEQLQTNQQKSFGQKIDLLIQQLLVAEGMASNSLNSAIKKTLPIKIGDRTYFLETNKIEYIEASGYYAEIKCEGKVHILRESLGSLIGMLDPLNFKRIHRSSIINKNYIKEVVSIGFGDVEIKMRDEKVLRVSKSYKEGLQKFLDI